MSIEDQGPSLQSQLDQVSIRIPNEIGDRITGGTAAIAQSHVAPGISVGDPAPEFSLPDATGRPVSLSALLAKGPVVLTFYRGEWCPFCNLQLRSLQAVLPRITELGASLVAISPQTPDHALSLTQKHNLAFSVLSDVDQSVIRAYRLQFTLSGDLEDLQVNVFLNDPADQNGDHSRSLPVPATFVIERDRTVRAAFVSADWRYRPEPTEILSALEGLL